MDYNVFVIVFPLWLKAFLFTQTVEIPVYVFVARGSAKIWRAALAGAACTGLTHPLFWFVWPRVVHDYTAYIVSGELIVTVVESAVFYLLSRPVSARLAIAAAFLANTASFGGGLLFRWLGIMS
jgi:hypothetical protein